MLLKAKEMRTFWPLQRTNLNKNCPLQRTKCAKNLKMKRLELLGCGILVLIRYEIANGTICSSPSGVSNQKKNRSFGRFFLHMSDFCCNFDLLPHELLGVLCFGSEGLPKLARRTYSSYLPPATIRCGSIASPSKVQSHPAGHTAISGTFLQKGLCPTFYPS